MLRRTRLLLTQVAAAICLASQVSVVMNRYDPFTTAANTHETELNSSNVNEASFGKLYSYYVDGSVYAQPLYLPAVQIPRRGAHNILYVATMNDKCMRSMQIVAVHLCGCAISPMRWPALLRSP